MEDFGKYLLIDLQQELVRTGLAVLAPQAFTHAEVAQSSKMVAPQAFTHAEVAPSSKVVVPHAFSHTETAPSSKVVAPHAFSHIETAPSSKIVLAYPAIGSEAENGSSVTLATVFFGGGTPSLMKPKSIANILDFLQKECLLDSEAEISMEANPGTFDKQTMKDFRDAGINRLSLGIQSFSDVNLQFLGRIYDSKQAHLAAEIVSNIFNNFSFDFIYGYECQDIDGLERDLATAVSFDCKHISCYQLSFDEGTVFHDRLLAGDMHDICDTDAIRYYNFIVDYLRDNGIFRYEISNYARPNFECIHNMNYWKYHDYLGIGPAAHSRLTIDGYKNEIVKISDPYAWKKSLEQKSDARESSKVLSPREKLEETLIMGLRLNEGIELKNIHENNSKDVVSEVLSDEKIRFLIDKQLVVEHLTKLQLTEAGLERLDSVVEFLCG
ncbi:hypothetical protein FACS1894122_05630 [Alphaproteobacteria bacterium]|nr:hypothetical protein FACS1894122_05630 [Alphaproteobacteria bacterium]